MSTLPCFDQNPENFDCTAALEALDRLVESRQPITDDMPLGLKCSLERIYAEEDMTIIEAKFVLLRRMLGCEES